MSRYRAGYSLVQVRCGCGHFDTLIVKSGEFITIDGAYELCERCQERKHDDSDAIVQEGWKEPGGSDAGP